MPNVNAARLLILTPVLCLSACVTYQKCGPHECVGDANISADISTRLQQYPSLQAPNYVRVRTSDHVVYLYGQVGTDLQSLMAQEVALSVPGVKRVVNSISLEYDGR
jgi:osmotically-inducible protein OsmY